LRDGIITQSQKSPGRKRPGHQKARVVSDPGFTNRLVFLD
jgi:hypothetical protein